MLRIKHREPHHHTNAATPVDARCNTAFTTERQVQLTLARIPSEQKKCGHLSLNDQKLVSVNY